MDVVACAISVCPLLLPVCWVLCDWSLWNCGVLNMPALFRELCLLDGPTTFLVASSLTAVRGARALTEIKSRVSSLSWLQLVLSAGGGESVCESAFDGFEATPESSSSSSLMTSTGGYSAGGTKSTSLVMIIEWLQYTLYWFLPS